MMRSPRVPLRLWRAAAVLGLAGSLGLLAACQDKNTTNVISNNGLDCGLVQADLVGTWTVTLQAGTVTLSNCTGVGTGGSVTTTSTPLVYNSIVVTANTTASSALSGVGYQVIGSGGSRSDELIANVEADSCLAQFQVWIGGSKAFLQCIGGLSLATPHQISGQCDSAEYPSSGVVTDPPDTFCSLSGLLSGTVVIQ